MNKKLLVKILSGTTDNNIRFADLCRLLLSLGFAERIKGDHHIFTKSGVEEIINIQPLKDRMSKSYQIKQVRKILVKYKIMKEV